MRPSATEFFVVRAPTIPTCMVVCDTSITYNSLVFPRRKAAALVVGLPKASTIPCAIPPVVLASEHFCVRTPPCVKSEFGACVHRMALEDERVDTSLVLLPITRLWVRTMPLTQVERTVEDCFVGAPFSIIVHVLCCASSYRGALVAERCCTLRSGFPNAAHACRKASGSDCA